MWSKLVNDISSGSIHRQSTACHKTHSLPATDLFAVVVERLLCSASCPTHKSRLGNISRRQRLLCHDTIIIMGKTQNNDLLYLSGLELGNSWTNIHNTTCSEKSLSTDKEEITTKKFAPPRFGNCIVTWLLSIIPMVVCFWLFVEKLLFSRPPVIGLIV